MSCVLRAKGVNFAVDEFLAGSPLKPIAIFRRGELPRYGDSQPDGPKPSFSGFNLSASDADFSEVQLQIANAIHFLEQNQAELARLVAFPGVEDVYLDFGIEERNIDFLVSLENLESGLSSLSILATNPTPTTSSHE
jgi:hypothetical protein